MILVIYNQKKDFGNYLKQIEDLCAPFDVRVKLNGQYPLKKAKNEEDLKLVVAIGGDGTMLSALHYIGEREIPLLPVHFGTLGFISSITPDEGLSLLKTFLSEDKKNIKLEKRNTIQVHLRKKVYRAFNEVVVTRGDSGRLMRLDLSINDKQLTSFRADGLLLSTPTGSTAYNLAAGGPILHPGLEAMIFNPICPHSLTLKPLIVPKDDRFDIRITPPENDKAVLVIDGLPISDLKSQESISCHIGEERFYLLKRPDENYYQTLKSKMHWGM